MPQWKARKVYIRKGIVHVTVGGTCYAPNQAMPSIHKAGDQVNVSDLVLSFADGTDKPHVMVAFFNDDSRGEKWYDVDHILKGDKKKKPSDWLAGFQAKHVDIDKINESVRKDNPVLADSRQAALDFILNHATEEDLKVVYDAYRRRHSLLEARVANKFHVGQSVKWESKYGRTVTGIVIKVNRRTIKVREGDNAGVGSLWNVSPGLLEAA